MKTDIQIAQSVKMEGIEKIAKKVGIEKDDLELYGKYKAKLEPSLWEKIKNKKDGKLILVTAMSPTPMGEGKTTTSIGLAQGLWKIGKKAVLSLREPSLGPSMGIKGGAAGGGYSQVVPMEDINLHFTGDIHAITTANNLLSAVIDNHIFHGNELDIDPRQILWKRCVDLNDRALRSIVVGLGGKMQGVPREENFNITVASEIMAIFCLAKDLKDLKKRLENILVAYSFAGKPIYAKQLKVCGALSAILKDALKPNLVQTLENTPAIVHGGPFANIAHGCSSLLATRYGLKLGDYLVTEAGFGADLGAEKFFNIKCRMGDLKPSVVAIVATIRSLKYNGGAGLDDLKKENLNFLSKGTANLKKHLENISLFGVPALVAVNVFPFDTKKEIDFLKKKCQEWGVEVAISKVWEKGGNGGKELAKKVAELADENKKTRFKVLYDREKSIKEKIETIAQRIYGAKKVDFSAGAKKQIEKLERDGLDKTPVCIAKTPYSFSDDPTILGAPKDFILNIKEIRISNGAGFVVALAGEIMTMPGLPAIPCAEKIDVSNDGKISGLF